MRNASFASALAPLMLFVSGSAADTATNDEGVIEEAVVVEEVSSGSADFASDGSELDKESAELEAEATPESCSYDGPFPHRNLCSAWGDFGVGQGWWSWYYCAPAPILTNPWAVVLVVCD